jgi:hypothetical protein
VARHHERVIGAAQKAEFEGGTIEDRVGPSRSQHPTAISRMNPKKASALAVSVVESSVLPAIIENRLQLVLVHAGIVHGPPHSP